MQLIAYECFTNEQKCSSIIHQSLLNHSTRHHHHHHASFLRFLLHWAASKVKLNHDRRTTAFGARQYTLCYECSRTRVSSHSDNDNSRSNTTSTSTRTNSRVQHHPPSTSLWQLQLPPDLPYATATLHPYTLKTVTYAQAIPLHVGGSGAVVAKELERGRE